MRRSYSPSSGLITYSKYDFYSEKDYRNRIVDYLREPGEEYDYLIHCILPVSEYYVLAIKKLSVN